MAIGNCGKTICPIAVRLSKLNNVYELYPDLRFREGPQLIGRGNTLSYDRELYNLILEIEGNGGMLPDENEVLPPWMHETNNPGFSSRPGEYT